jgi:hypothetical protein
MNPYPKKTSHFNDLIKKVKTNIQSTEMHTEHTDKTYTDEQFNSDLKKWTEEYNKIKTPISEKTLNQIKILEKALNTIDKIN